MPSGTRGVVRTFFFLRRVSVHLLNCQTTFHSSHLATDLLLCTPISPLPQSFDLISKAMTISVIPLALRQMLYRRPLVLYATIWTALLTTTVAVASFSPEIAFVWAVSPSSSFSRACGPEAVRLPLDGAAGEVVCVPAQLFGRSKLDLFLPPVFAALVVVGSAWFVQAIALWEAEEDGLS